MPTTDGSASRAAATASNLARRASSAHQRSKSCSSQPGPSTPTVASWVIDLTDLVASVTAGPPCESSYEPLRPAFARAGVATPS